MPLPQFPSIAFFKIKNLASKMSFTAGADFSLALYPFDKQNLNQYWLPQRNRDGTFKLISRATGKVVDAQWGISPGAIIQQYRDRSLDPNADFANQRWKLLEANPDPDSPDGFDYFVYADTSVQVWTVGLSVESGVIEVGPAADALPGTPVVLNPLGSVGPVGLYIGSTFYYGQSWLLDPNDVPNAVQVVQIASMAPNSIDDQGNPLVLDVFSFLKSPGFVQLFRNNGGFNQYWSVLQDQDDEFFSIQSVCSGQAVANPQNQNGQVALDDADMTSPQQQWNIQPTGDTDANGNVVVSLISQNGGLALDSLGGRESTRVQARADDGGSLNQRWALVPYRP